MSAIQISVIVIILKTVVHINIFHSNSTIQFLKSLTLNKVFFRCRMPYIISSFYRH